MPAQQKIFSLFEEHTDIIVKGSRDIHYGKAPRQMAVDGGYVRKDNLKGAKAKGVKDMAFALWEKAGMRG